MKSLSQHINESIVTEDTIDGIQLSNNLTKSEFGKKVKSINDLTIGSPSKRGSSVIMFDAGMNQWIGDLEITKNSKNGFDFMTTDSPNDVLMSYTKAELEDDISNGLVYIQQ